MSTKDRRRHPRRQEHQPPVRRREGADRHLFNVKEHEIRSIIGPNGAGKSSMLNRINGVYTRPEGKITFRGKTFPDEQPPGPRGHRA